jgi:hypothetical protein
VRSNNKTIASCLGNKAAECGNQKTTHVLDDDVILHKELRRLATNGLGTTNMTTSSD